MSSASLILTDGGLALSEPKAVGAQASTKVLAASSLGSCLVFVSSAVVTVALAAIGRDMRLSPLELQWVMNAELLPLAALTLVAGALGDRFGQKRIFLAGIALYGLGAAAIGFAPSFAPLIVGRFLQGLGEALILPNGLSVLGQAFAADQKARAVGIWSAAAAVASGVAPAIAGAILDHGSWRTTLLMLLPVAASALAVGAVWIPKDSPTSHARVDVGGAVLSTVGLGGLGAGLTSLTNGSGPNLWVLFTLIVGLGGLAGLIVTQRRLGENAMLPPSLFASRSVVGANLFTALLYGAFTIMLTLIPFVMIRGAHLPTLVAGLAFIPLQVLITVVSPLAGMLCRRFGRRLPLFAGGAVVALGCAMTLCVGSNATYWADIFPPILLLSLGMSLAIAPLTTLVLTSVESDRAGTASGVNSAVSRAGSRDLVGERYCGNLRRPPRQQSREPGSMFDAMDLGVTDGRKRAGHEQAAQIAVTLFADIAEPVLAPLECCLGTSPIQAEKLRPDRILRAAREVLEAKARLWSANCRPSPEDREHDIASPTDRLALNATIEAARTGEASKGFAFVGSNRSPGIMRARPKKILGVIQNIRAAAQL